MIYDGKQVAVLGLGESGEAAARLLAREGAHVIALDSTDDAIVRRKLARLRASRVEGVLGREAEGFAGALDLSVVSPGIDPGVPLVQNLIRRRVEMIGEMELAYSLCASPIVAITGTNGKTTTTDLVAAMLAGCGWKTLAGGNIGVPFSRLLLDNPSLELVVLEVSSFQLERIRRFRPRVAVWLNFAPDHLDRYPDLESYRAAKLRIFENQTEDDWAVVQFSDGMPECRARRLTFSATRDGADLALREGMILYRDEPVLRMAETRLRGLHNVENAMAAIGVGIALGIEPRALCGPIREYRLRPHRLELIGEVGGVLYINDSKSTNPDSLEKALLAMERPVVLIAGGKDKGFEFGALGELLAQRVRGVVLIGEIRESLRAQWGDRVACHFAETLREAVVQAAGLARPGDAVLLSPGTSSYDMFENYEDRGEQFRQIVQEQGD